MSAALAGLYFASALRAYVLARRDGYAGRRGCMLVALLWPVWQALHALGVRAYECPRTGARRLGTE